MAALDRPLRISRNVFVQQVGAETLVYDGQRHRAFCLNAGSALVWKLADGTRSFAEISAVSMESSASISEELVCYAVEILRADGLIEPVQEVKALHTAEHLISRRIMLQRLGAGGAMLLPAIASIVAPTAAQAYNGCVDCSTSNAARARRMQQIQGSNQ